MSFGNIYYSYQINTFFHKNKNFSYKLTKNSHFCYMILLFDKYGTTKGIKMEKLKSTFEREIVIYGYYEESVGFIPYHAKGCKRINCLFCKESKKVFAI